MLVLEQRKLLDMERWRIFSALSVIKLFLLQPSTSSCDISDLMFPSQRVPCPKELMVGLVKLYILHIMPQEGTAKRII